MKKILAIAAIIASLLIGVPFVVHAQTSNCIPVTQNNVNDCCVNNSNTTADVQASCQQYYENPTGATTSSQTDTCSSITQNNVNSCCINNSSTSANIQSACQQYYENPGITVVTPQQAGGSQSTGALNSGTNTSYAGNPALSPSASDQKALQSCSAIKFDNLLNIAIWVRCIIGVIVIPGIFTLAFVVFLWGVFRFIRASEQKDKEEGKNFILMGLIGLFVMVSVWGILKILNTTLGISSTVPALQTEYLNPNNASTGTN